MEQVEFDEQIVRLEFAFTGRVPKDFEFARPAWFKELRWASKLALAKCITDLMHHERFPVLAQVLAGCNEHTPRYADGWLMNHDFCYKHIESENMQCGCPVCHPNFWCKQTDCKIPVEARMKRSSIEKEQPSGEYCYLHSDDPPDQYQP